MDPGPKPWLYKCEELLTLTRGGAVEVQPTKPPSFCLPLLASVFAASFVVDSTLQTPFCTQRV